MAWTLYILECADGTLYTGITNDLAARLEKHAQGAGAKYTRGRGPYKVMRTEEHASRSAALKREAEIKSFDREQKLILVGQ